MRSKLLGVIFFLLLGQLPMKAQMEDLQEITAHKMIIEDFVKNRLATVVEFRSHIYRVRDLDTLGRYWDVRYSLLLAELYYVDSNIKKAELVMNKTIARFGLSLDYYQERFKNYPEMTSYIESNFIELYQSYEAGIDKNLLALYNDISTLDQTWRKQDNKVRNSFSDEYQILGYVDSLVTETFLSLFRKGIYFTVDNIGSKVSSKYAFYLHLADTKDTAKWNELLFHLKKEVVAGSLTPKHLAEIIDRHGITTSDSQCKPMGSNYFLDMYPLCDLKLVDERRNEIGLPALGFEYKLLFKKLPVTYKWDSSEYKLLFKVYE